MRSKNIDEENARALDLVQALIGAITPNFRRVSLSMDREDGAITLFFLLATEDAGDREEIEDIAFEFDVLLPQSVKVIVEVVVDSRSLDEVDVPGRVVFGSRED
jgi:hypothetical protein